ncbi:MAG TPA: ParB N-terminal domain-containing protein [Terriglobales bacterium]|nr:ParB N-terminal domain-containing protein [Terriglobales bacterium]
MSRKREDLGTSAIGVKYLPTKQLHPNPHNPRMLFDKLPLDVLRESIGRVGILVPLTVYLESARDRYVILDGQRRWICAQDLGLDKVPVNQVAEPSLVQNIVTMFQIHKLREDWELMPTALKIELLMKQVGDRNNARLAELTGLDEAVIVRCKKLISYDKRFQDMMLDPDPEKRIKADFFIELYPVLHDRDVAEFEWFSPVRFTKQMLSKYLEEPRTIKAVTDFRLIKQHITNARRIGGMKKFSTRMQRFAEEHSTPLAHLELAEASIHAEAKAITRKVDTLEKLLAELDVETYYGEEELWKSVTRLLEVLERKLREADKRR